jgi:2-methylcitrate dehydratase PrpD
VTVVEVELANGTRLAERIEAVRGTPRNPMSRAEVVEKASDLIGPVLGRETAARLAETVLSIEKVSEIRSLQPLLRGR